MQSDELGQRIRTDPLSAQYRYFHFSRLRIGVTAFSGTLRPGGADP